MLARGFGICLLAVAQSGFAQVPDAKDEEEIRRVITLYHEGVAKADAAKVATVASPDAWGVSPGGTAAMRVVARARTSSRTRSTLIRRVDLINQNTAVALGVWRDFAPPPFGTGTVQYTLVRDQGSWRIAHRHDAFLPELRQVTTPLDTKAAQAGGAGDWESLFDGKTLKGWVGTDSETPVEASWRIGDESVISMPGGNRSSLLTQGQYLYFELQFEWMTAAKANSGVKYRLLGFDRLGGLSREPLGFEYQVADDEGDPGARADPKQRSGALYAVAGVERSLARPVGEWNESRIVVRPEHVEHWLNGQRTARHATDVPFASAIALQHHTTEVRFRNIRIRRLGAETPER